MKIDSIRVRHLIKERILHAIKTMPADIPMTKEYLRGLISAEIDAAILDIQGEESCLTTTVTN